MIRRLIRLTITDVDGNATSRVIEEFEPVPPSWFRSALTLHLEVVDEEVS